jgi:hypothetical protein
VYEVIAAPFGLDPAQLTFREPVAPGVKTGGAGVPGPADHVLMPTVTAGILNTKDGFR